MPSRLAILATVALGACGRIGFDGQGGAALDASGDSVDAIVGNPFTIELTTASNIWGVATLPDGGAVVVGAAIGPTQFGTVALDGIGAQDVLIAGVSPTGTVRWAQLLGGPQDDRALAVATAPDGTIYVTGMINGTVNLGGAPLTTNGNDVFVASFTADGDHRWSIRAGGNDADSSNFDLGSGIAVAANGDVVVGGVQSGLVDFGNGVVLPATTALSNAFVARLTSAGTALWGRRWGVTGSNSVDDVAVDVTGEVYVSGVYSGSPDLGTGPVPGRGGFDAMVIALTAGGADRWNENFGGSNNDRLYGIEVSSGTVVVSGYYWDTIDLSGIPLSAGLADGLFAGFSTTGTLQWATRYGGTGCDFIAGSGSIDGKAAIAGTFSGVITLGTEMLTPAGGTDSVVFQVRDNTVPWSEGFGESIDEIAYGVAGSLEGGVYVVGGRNVGFDGGCYGTASNGYVTRL